jgi:hypothetical protein
MDNGRPAHLHVRARNVDNGIDNSTTTLDRVRLMPHAGCESGTQRAASG